MKRGAPEHKKMKRLAALLQIPLAQAVGTMELLFHFASRQAPEGDIGSHPDEDIAHAVHWNKKPATLISALLEAAWLDPNEKYRFIIHDWPDHADDSVRKWLTRHKKDFLETYGQRPAKIETVSGKSADGVQPSREAEAKALAEAQKPGGGPGGTEMHWSVDEGYQPFVAAYREARPNTLGEEFADAIRPWRMLAFDQQAKALRGVIQRVRNGIWRPAEPHFVMPPSKYLQVEWKRDVTVAIAPPTSKSDDKMARVLKRVQEESR